jgi:hypothetical protein
MHKLYLTASLIALQMTAHNNEVIETVVVTTKGGDVRINKADFDADQAEGGEGKYKLASKAKQGDNADMTAQTEATTVPPGAIVPPAPSAPNFNPAPGEPAVPPSATGAVPPSGPSPNSYLVMKDGKKYFVVDTGGAKQGSERGFNDAGYATELEAVEAIKFAPPPTSPTAADPMPPAAPSA